MHPQGIIFDSQVVATDTDQSFVPVHEYDPGHTHIPRHDYVSKHSLAHRIIHEDFVPIQQTFPVLLEDPKETQRFENLVEASNRPLFQARSVFPFDLFPDELMVDETKVTFIYNTLFDKTVHSVPIKDIIEVIVSMTPFFATLKVTEQVFRQEGVEINNLYKSDSLHAKRVIEGLVLAVKQGIDLSKIDPDILYYRIEELGMASIPTSEEGLL